MPAARSSSLSGGELAGERHIPGIRHRSPHIGQRTSGENLDLGYLLQGAGWIGGAEPASEAGFDRDGRERVTEQIMKVACDPGAFVLRCQAGQLRRAPRREHDYRGSG